MSDIIQVLPEHVANQIAAGEVVQRPASALKEFLENSIDAGSSKIDVVAKDGGKLLLQITDNGCGMSFTDARMAFERHATSKIRKAEDLFNILTMGFRGEALASIASVAQVELKTRRHEDELGTQIIIEGSNIIKHEVCSCPVGTTFVIKNLFYNIPARRNFLKTLNIEYGHILDEFTRVAMAHPEVEMNLYHNDLLVHKLPKGNLKQRIVSLCGNSFKEKLLHFGEETNYVTIDGFVGKPDTAKKKRGDQFFFVNKRFIKHPFFHHAISAAYDDIIPTGHHPSYFINITIDPKNIDVNIHPTKTEIKFDDEKTIYGFLKASVRQVIGQFHLSPTLEFEMNDTFNNLPFDKERPIIEPKIHINPDYNPFERQASSYIPKTQNVQTSYNDKHEKPSHSLFEQQRIIEIEEPKNIQTTIEHTISEEKESKDFIQISDKYIVSNVKSGLMVIDKTAALQRIYYEKLVHSYENKQPLCQQLIFPETLTFIEKDYIIIDELWDDIKKVGFDIENFGQNAIIIHGTPPDCNNDDLSEIFDEFIEQHKTTYSTLKSASRDIVLKSSALRLAARKNNRMNKHEIEHFIDTLFNCNEPYLSPMGKQVMKIINIEELANKFE
ncbi:MAG: DNA mismatch repair endonuclease MutL [Bacteroidota bacterium]